MSRIASKTTPKRPNAANVRLRPLQRPDLVHEAVRQLRRQILDGAFLPENVLPPEGQLGVSLGVSRTVVREAMRTLATQGLVEVSQGRKPRVKPADPQTVLDTFDTYLQRESHSLLDLIEVRRPLEAAIAALAAERATDSDIEKLEASFHQQTIAKTKNDRVCYDIQFHDRLAEAAHNPVFLVLLKAVAGLMRRSREETLERIGVERSLKGHRAILDAVKQHDGEAASRAMLWHLANAEQDLREKKL